MSDPTNNTTALAEDYRIRAARQMLGEARARSGAFTDVIARAAVLDVMLGLTLEALDEHESGDEPALYVAREIEVDTGHGDMMRVLGLGATLQPRQNGDES